jgi:hypothetical protein
VRETLAEDTQACARLRSCYLQVVEQRLTGDIEDDKLLRLALARYNKASFYDVLRKKVSYRCEIHI